MDTVAVERPDPGAEPAADPAESAAGELLTRARLAYEAAEPREALELARRVLSDYPATSAAEGARWVAARAAFALERYAEARDLAEAHAAAAAGPSAEEARALAELARDALEPPESAPVVLGAVLPRTGPRAMVRYSEWLLQGIQLAVQEAERREGRPIELVVEDDAGGTRTRQAVAELERRGAVAIVGPMLPQQVDDAAAARVNGSLVTVTPTAPEHPRWPQVYSVNAPDTRGAQELARYAMEVGLGQAALLYPRQADYERKASAFAVEYEALGGVVRVSVPYDSGTTTFDTHMRRILDAVAPAESADSPAAGDTSGSGALPDGVRRPFVLFVAAPERDVRQIAPQVAFYGLDSAGAQVLGDEAWASATVRRVVPAQDLEGVIAASPFPPGRADAVADPAFIERYEQTFRRSLENQLPALGYDAANLALQALPNRSVTPGRLARRFGLLTGIRGASGTFSIRADRIVRTPYLVVIRNGSLATAPQPSEYRPPVPAGAGPVGGGGE